MRNDGSPRWTRALAYGDAEDAERELIEAWRTSRGTKLIVVLPGPARFALDAGKDLDLLDASGLSAYLESAVDLTGSEAIFGAPDGRRWLAQAVGPVWAPTVGAEGLVATRFTSLDGPFESFQAPGSPLRPDRPDHLDLDAALSELWTLAPGNRGDSEQ